MVLPDDPLSMAVGLLPSNFIAKQTSNCVQSEEFLERQEHIERQMLSSKNDCNTEFQKL